LQALTFHNYADKEGLLEALDVLREMNASEDKLPATFEDVPVDFVSAQWRSRVLNRDGTVNRRDYEMCILADLRDALRSGTGSCPPVFAGCIPQPTSLVLHPEGKKVSLQD
jgi:hypothetical protein